MSIAKSGTPLNDCGACEGQTASTPSRIDNRHGLDRVSYRIGDYHQFRESMLSKLSSSELGALQGLTTRDQNDFSIALIDAWANVSEVLTFYQEYFANEGLLLTAKERLSVLEHARLIGYELNPGVAASSYLAFTMDEPLAAIENPILESSVLAGSQVQSSPGPDETAEIFETLSDIQTRVRWNSLRPRLNQPQIIDQAMESIVLDGITTFIRVGDDVLLIDDADDEYIRKVNDVVVDESNQTTQLIIVDVSPSPNAFTLDPQDPGSYSLFVSKTIIDVSVINLFMDYSWAIEDVVAIADSKHWDLAEIAERINMPPVVVTPVISPMAVHGFHQTANLFGYNAMKVVEYDLVARVPKTIPKWSEWIANESDGTLYLDNAYSQITPNSYCILRIDDVEPESLKLVEPKSFKLVDAATVSRSEYGISSKSSKLTLPDDSNVFGEPTNTAKTMKDVVRKAVVRAQSESLPLGSVAILDTIKGETLLLNVADLELRSQQFIAVSGERSDQLGVTVSEVVQIDKVRLKHGFTEIAFATSLQYEYRRDSVSLNANVAPASHGESVSEILGSGNAAMASQRFYLKQMPLTYISAEVPSGALSTLEVRVNDVVWHEVESFLGRSSEERIFTTKLEDGGSVQVLFGDGIEGSRLSSGNNNVIARYRRGIGLGGLVKAQQANMLLTRPLGIKGATNPVKSSGGDDPEQLAAAQRNAPLGLLTLGRTVSLSDYEDFCRAFSGVAKARAVSVAANGVPSIIITIAGPNGEVLDQVGQTYKSLLAALSNAGDPYTRFVLLAYRPAYFKLDAGLYIHSDYQADLVLEMARDKMRQQFSFDLRAFNQAVHLSEVISTLQKVDGVIAVDVNHIFRSDASPVSPPPRSIIPLLSTDGFSTQQGSELITLDPAPLDQLRSKS